MKSSSTIPVSVSMNFLASLLWRKLSVTLLFSIFLLATIFGEVMLKTPVEARKSRTKRTINAMNRKKATFIYQFLVNDLTKPYNWTTHTLFYYCPTSSFYFWSVHGTIMLCDGLQGDVFVLHV